MSFKQEAKASRAGKHSAMGLGGHKAKALDVGPGHTWDGQSGLSSEEKVNEPQRIPTRKAGGKVEGHAAMRRMDRAPRKAGGRVATPKHSDEAEDRKLIDKMVKPSARTGKADGGGKWIGSAIKHPGALHKELGVAKGEKIPAKKLAKAAHSDDPKLAKRARLAETLKHMPHKDDGRAERASGGKVGKGKTNITIVVAPGGAGQQPQTPAVPRPVPVPVPAAVPPSGAGSPPMVGMGPPPGSPAMGGMPPAPMMPRAAGGRIPHMEAGAGSGEGRLEKIDLQKKADRRG